jgi:replicative DNA helicase
MIAERTTPAAWARNGSQKISNRVGADPGTMTSDDTDTYLSVLDAEAAFVGALLHQSAAIASEALRLVVVEDFADLRLSVLADVCRRLAEAGVAPDPVTVLAHVRRHAIVTGAEAIRGFSLLLFEIYRSVPVPSNWRHYLAAVLDTALRRRVQMMAARLGQATERDSLDSVLPLIDREVVAVVQVKKRQAAVEAVGT